MNASLLPQVIDTLQQHPEQDRIKKLIHWVCEQNWPRSAAEAKDVEGLLPQLLALAHSQNAVKREMAADVGQAETFPTALQSILVRGASQLSKRQKYTEIALAICQVLAPLYGDHVSSDVCEGGESAADVFELRLAVIKYTTPLSAKILIYSALKQVITGQRQDWMSLKQVSLDELLFKLRQTYPTFAGVETQLWQTVDEVQLLDQPSQTLEAVLQAIKPFYAPSQMACAPLSTSSEVKQNTQSRTPSLEEEDQTTLRSALKNSAGQVTRTRAS